MINLTGVPARNSLVQKLRRAPIPKGRRQRQSTRKNSATPRTLIGRLIVNFVSHLILSTCQAQRHIFLVKAWCFTKLGTQIGVIAEVFFIVAISELFLICFFLFSHQKGRKVSHALLGTFFLSMALNLLDSYLISQHKYAGNNLLVGWSACLPLLFGPLLYLYAQSILIAGFRLSWKKLQHFAPFVLLFFMSETNYVLQPPAVREYLLARMRGRDIPPLFYWTSGIIFSYFLSYAAAALEIIRRYRRLAVNTYSDEELINISWLSNTILYFTFCIAIAAANGYLRLTWLSKYYYFLLSFLLLLILLFVNRVLLKAMRRPELFALIPSGPTQPPGNVQKQDVDCFVQPDVVDDPGATGHSTIPVDPSLEEIKKRLLSYMESAKPYLDPDLGVEGLASRLGVRPRLLSQAINECLRQNFFDFINRHRIEAAKGLLSQPKDKKMTILEVLYEVGFNSKSSFNTLFKKYTGLTPSEFKKNKQKVF
jgi:AraC-like DNA-binding protein